MARQMLETPSMSKVRRGGRFAIWWLAAVLATWAASSRAARAADAPAPTEVETSWYGWQTLLSDAGAIGLWSLAGVVSEAQYDSASYQSYQAWSNALTVAGFAVYVLGAPAIHLAHGHGDKVADSLVMRVGLPFAGALVGVLAGTAACGRSDDEVPCPVITGVLGFAAGGVAAMVLDAVIVAREPVGHPSGSRFQTLFIPTSGGGTFTLAGRF
jgi:hypothetical protein